MGAAGFRISDLSRVKRYNENVDAGTASSYSGWLA